MRITFILLGLCESAMNGISIVNNPRVVTHRTVMAVFMTFLSLSISIASIRILVI